MRERTCAGSDRFQVERHAPVAASSSQYCMASLPETSARFPAEMIEDTPSRRLLAD
jgi:hypothetical protein